MTTRTLPIAITCPDWCTRPPEEHVTSLWDMEGNCIHYADSVYVPDTSGFHGALEEPRFHPEASVYMTSHTRPDGLESAPPILHFMGGSEMSVPQALALADAIRSMVETYRAAGGKS